MNVFVTFDVEVWCNGWDDLERSFPSSFERYVFGRSAYGDFALPQTLAILERHGLKAVFFVEPLFAARFGSQHLETIVGLIRQAGQEVQLHLHPEWTNEATKPPIPDCSIKRQHLLHYTLGEQTTLIALGRQMLEAAGSGPICAFRAGSFAVNHESFDALRNNGIFLDSSLNRCYEVSAPEILRQNPQCSGFVVKGVSTFPVTVLKDGFGRDRPAHVSACGFAEIRDALVSAHAAGAGDFVIVSHNFEMLKQGSSDPDWIVVRRFEALCEFLANHRQIFNVRGFAPDLQLVAGNRKPAPEPRASWISTTRRHLEQARRRLI